MTPPILDPPPIAVIGVGNIVCSDDGLGVHAVRRLGERYRVPAFVGLIEGGTAGLLLLPYLASARHAIVVDAIDTRSPPGTLVRIDADKWNRASAAMTPHDIAVPDLLAAARLSGAWPQRLVLHGAQPASTALGTQLSAPLAVALDPLVDQIAAELTAWGVPVTASGVAQRQREEGQNCRSA